jgi:hypothetical protein
MCLADLPLIPFATTLEQTDAVLRDLRLLILELEAQERESADRLAPIGTVSARNCLTTVVVPASHVEAQPCPAKPSVGLQPSNT